MEAVDTFTAVAAVSVDTVGAITAAIAAVMVSELVLPAWQLAR
jgi:hypothetical protein